MPDEHFTLEKTLDGGGVKLLLVPDVMLGFGNWIKRWTHGRRVAEMPRRKQSRVGESL